MTSRAHYFDTSALLAMLFHQEHAQALLELWTGSSARISSMLAYFECINVTHRAYQKLPKTMQEGWLKESMQWIEKTMRSISLHEMNMTVLQRLKREPNLGKARTLDAIHLSTALLFHDAGAEVHVVSCDEKMRKLAQELGFLVLPE